MFRALGVFLACAFPTAGGSLLVTQDSNPGIPSEVVSLLMPTGGMPGAAGGELRAGAPPSDFPSGVFPPGTVVNATMVSPVRGTTVVGTAATLTMAEFEKHETALVAAGWIGSGPRMRGFVSTSATSMNSVSLCRGTDFLVLSPHTREAGGLFVRATVMRDPRRTCVPSPSLSMLADVDVPRLTAPAGARMVGGGGGGGGLDTMTSTMRLETKLAARAVVEHYERQLLAVGWKVAGRVRDGEEFAMTRFEVPSRIGPALSAWLSATLLGDTGDQDVFLRVMRNTRDPRMGGSTFGVTGGIAAPPGVR